MPQRLPQESAGVRRSRRWIPRALSAPILRSSPLLDTGTEQHHNSGVLAKMVLHRTRGGSTRTNPQTRDNSACGLNFIPTALVELLLITHALAFRIPLQNQFESRRLESRCAGCEA